MRQQLPNIIVIRTSQAETLGLPEIDSEGLLDTLSHLDYEWQETEVTCESVTCKAILIPINNNYVHHRTRLFDAAVAAGAEEILIVDQTNKLLHVETNDLPILKPKSYFITQSKSDQMSVRISETCYLEVSN